MSNKKFNIFKSSKYILWGEWCKEVVVVVVGVSVRRFPFIPVCKSVIINIHVAIYTPLCKAMSKSPLLLFVQKEKHQQRRFFSLYVRDNFHGDYFVRSKMKEGNRGVGSFAYFPENKSTKIKTKWIGSWKRRRTGGDKEPPARQDFTVVSSRSV